MENDYEVKCNLCGGRMKYIEHNGTFIWVCEDCPCIQFEYYTDTDFRELGDYLNSSRISKIK